MEANGAILGVSLIIDDVLSSGRDAAPLRLQTTGDTNITATSDREVLKKNSVFKNCLLFSSEVELKPITTRS